MVDCSELAQDFEVKFYFLRSEKGGITAPAYNGHQPHFHFSGHDVGARQLYPDVLQVNRRDTVRAKISLFLGIKNLSERFLRAWTFQFVKGRKTIGERQGSQSYRPAIV